MPYYQRQHIKRLDTLFEVVCPPKYFVTICSFRRRKILTMKGLAEEIATCLSQSLSIHGWAVGRYVIMPDHVHFFCSPRETEKTLSEFVRDVRKRISRRAHEKGIEGIIWQRDFFDRLLRSDESYEEKSEYMLQNPVRAGLCASQDDWMLQGDFDLL